MNEIITPFNFYKKLRKQHYGLRYSLHLVRVLKQCGHCYVIINGEKALFYKA